MSKKLSFIDTSDKYRALLTDVLPYETTLIFSNDGFYDLILDLIKNGYLSKVENILRKKDFYIPYSYSIIRKDSKQRKLSIPHPVSQLDLCDLYEEYADYIIYLCSKSSYSLRYPSSIVSKFYKKGILISQTDDEVKTASNFFVYSKYRMLYKFYDSKQFIKLEKKYSYLRKLDISNCFSSIYTHTISWAVKTKNVAKNQIGRNNFEQKFDKLMQKNNYNETAGIIIGPEFSRIFAEIIFQCIDKNVEKKLKDSKNLKLYIDYEIYRYVDDIFVFSNVIENLEIIENVIKDELEPFRLFLNDKKEEDFEVPFTSDVSSAKDELNDLFDCISKSIQKDSDELLFSKIDFSLSSFITRFKNILYRNNVSIKTLDSFIFFKLKCIIQKLNNESLSLKIEQKRQTLAFLEFFIEISFYIFSLDIRITSSYKMSYFLIIIENFLLKYFNNSDKININKIIFDNIFQLIKKELNKNNTEFIEIANLLLVLKSLNFRENIPNETIDYLISNILSSENVDYFSLITLLAFTSNNIYYKNQEEKIIDYIKSIELDIKRADHFILILDYLTFPYVEKDQKIKFFNKINIKNNWNLTIAQQDKIVDYISGKKIFTDWSNNINFEEKLLKKEFIAPYE